MPDASGILYEETLQILMKTKICKRCGNDLALSEYYMSSKKYVVGGVVKAIHGSLRTVCKKCEKELYHPPGWHLKYLRGKNVDNFPVENLHMNK